MPELTLTTERLQLCIHVMHEAERIALLANDPAIGLMMNLPHPYSVQDANKWIKDSTKLYKQGKRVSFSIKLIEPQQLIGVISLLIDKSQNQAELGYWLGRDYWQQGYATEAARRVVEFAFTELNLAYLYSEVLVVNDASDNVLIKIGMEKKAVLLQDIKRFGRTYDKYVYGLDNPSKGD